MKGFRQLFLSGCLGALIFLSGCAKDPGTPPEVLIDGVSVVVGESTPGSLKEDGFTTDNVQKMIVELPDKSWTSSIFLQKDGISYASLSLVNESSEKKLVGLCVSLIRLWMIRIRI